MKKLNFVSNLLWIVSLVCMYPAVEDMIFENGKINDLLENFPSTVSADDFSRRVTVIIAIAFTLLFGAIIMKAFIRKHQDKTSPNFIKIIWKILVLLVTTYFVLVSFIGLLFLNIDVSNIPV